MSETCDDGMEIIKTIITLANTLGMSVIAEGVETKEHVSFLQKIIVNLFKATTTASLFMLIHFLLFSKKVFVITISANTYKKKKEEPVSSFFLCFATFHFLHISFMEVVTNTFMITDLNRRELHAPRQSKS